MPPARAIEPPRKQRKARYPTNDRERAVLRQSVEAMRSVGWPYAAIANVLNTAVSTVYKYRNVEAEATRRVVKPWLLDKGTR